MRLSDLLHLSGGLTPDADQKINLYRSNGTEVHSTAYTLRGANGMLAPDDDPLLQSNDLVSVRGNAVFVSMTETVTLSGEVEHPGVYPAYDGSRQTPKTLYQLISQAGGTMPDTFPAGIVLYRQQAAIHTNLQQQELARTMRNLDEAVGILTTPTPAGTTRPTSPAPPEAASTPAMTTTPSIPGADTASGTKPAVVVEPTSGELTPPAPTAQANPTAIAQAQTVDSISRTLAKALVTDQGNTVVLVIPPRSMQEQQFSLSIPINAEPIIKSQGKFGDIALEPGDIIYVPKRPTTVTVMGGVINNGSVVYHEGQSLDYYLNAVGGISADGNKQSVVVMRMNGLVLPLRKAKTINPGDIIIVPTKHMLQVIHTQGTAERVLQTISQTALSVLPFIK
jgi:protein involved in polysaccharide export with SLBB domain